MDSSRVRRWDLAGGLVEISRVLSAESDDPLVDWLGGFVSTAAWAAAAFTLIRRSAGRMVSAGTELVLYHGNTLALKAETL